ncbi:MAG TPA: hypothetical protein VFK73_02770 [Paludibacter sp.]|nr:hypothetical protein [Paludibacter sp.]
MKNIGYFFVLVLIIIGFSKCYYHNEETLYADLTNSCDTTNITFKAKVVPILKEHCYKCHSNAVADDIGDRIRLEDYPDVKNNLNRMYGAITHQDNFRPMPKNMTAKIDTCQIKIIRIWMEADGLDN